MKCHEDKNPQPHIQFGKISIRQEVLVYHVLITASTHQVITYNPNLYNHPILPNFMHAKYLRIICPRCKKKQIIYGKATLRIKCDQCNRLLIQPTGGKTRIKAGIKQIIEIKWQT